ncbi:MAG: DUF814 domain-containing protein [Desulfovibrio sp.]|nr:DUF814 domain-containing protein [Desulfovibrio sp.]
MDAHLLRRLTDLMPSLLQKSRLEKIQSLAPAVYSLIFFTEQGKIQLCIRTGRQDAFIFLTQKRLTAGKAPEAEIMRLRKYLQGQRVLGMQALPFERQIWLFFSGQTEEAGKLPCLLIDLKEGIFLKALSPNEYPNPSTPAWPEPKNLEEACLNWRAWPTLTPKLRRTLAQLETSEQEALLSDLISGGGDLFLYRSKETAKVVSISAWPLPDSQSKKLSEEIFEDPCQALEKAGQELVFAAIAAEAEHEAQVVKAQKLKKLKRLATKLEEENIRLNNMVACQSKAELIKNNLLRLNPQEKCAELSLPLENGQYQRLELDPKYTILEDMQRLFHTALRGKRGLQHLLERKKALAEELAKINASPSLAGKKENKSQNQLIFPSLPKGVSAFLSSDGFLLFRGKSAKGNLACRKLGKGYDIWLHTENGPGAHVVIRLNYPGQTVPERTLKEAGALAACKSWQTHSDLADIQYAEIRHIKPLRGQAEGTVKIDKLLCTLRVPVDHSLEEKLQIGPEQKAEK